MRHGITRSLGLMACLVIVGACTPPPSPVLAVRNDSDSTFFVRLEGAPGSTTRSYRVDPGAMGRALAPGDDQAATKLTVYSAECEPMIEQADPTLGSMDIDAAGSISLTVGLSRIENVMPVLPLDESCS